MRRLGSRSWRDVSGGRIDPSQAYLLRLPSGRSIALFFYDGPISRAVAFERLLISGEAFAQRLVGAFSETRSWPQLVHIATDGETYGHHHRHGDMALAYALHYIEHHQLAQLTNYGEYLEKHPPTHQVEIFENTSWSCAHGVERWRSDCGCNSGGHPGWNQAWRGPLRQAFDWLRDTLAPAFEEAARPFLHDPWAARNDYIDVVLERSPERLAAFFERHARRPLSETETTTVLKLLELQRHAMLMYTSCGWFFDELSGLETMQVIQYAGRAVQLAQELFGDTLEAQFLERLAAAKSNLPEHRDGRHLYEKWVKPAMVDWEKIGAHYAVRSLFEPYPEHARVYCYTADVEDYRSLEAGKAKLVVGRARLASTITLETARLSFGVLYFGDHNLNGGVRPFVDDATYDNTVHELTEAFSRADFPELIRLLDRHFGESTYSLRSLFRDEQRQITHRILEATLAETEAIYRQIYENRAPLMRFLTDLHIPLPRAFQAAAEFVLNSDLRRVFETEPLDPERLDALLEAARLVGIAFDAATLSFAITQSLNRLATQLHAQPTALALLQQLETAASMVHRLPFEVDLWQVQNVCYDLVQRHYGEMRARAEQHDAEAEQWLTHFRSLCTLLALRLEA
ncbi:MAG: glycoside hydrolase [Candidatus Tectimicrobiota bacterium]|nr:MAG: glycoside hydrolase [Candidatus Tectomicrobia bacterium]